MNQRDLATDSQGLMLTQMVEIIRNIRDGLSLGEAATLVRVSKSRLQCWRALAADGTEPFASFTEHTAAAEIGAKLDVLRNLKALSTVDARAGEALLQRLDRNHFTATLPAAGARPPTEGALNVELAIGNEPMGANLTALLEENVGEPVALASFEPRKER